MMGALPAIVLAPLLSRRRTRMQEKTLSGVRKEKKATACASEP
jgi:hypothetical protein